jgi:mRNA interferase MazF
MKRGEVWWANFEPSIGGEIQKKRPAVIVSNDSANAVLNRVQVVPLTSKTQKLYPGEALITLNDAPHKALADQIATVSKTRFLNLLGTISLNDMKAIERAIKTQLALL